MGFNDKSSDQSAFQELALQHGNVELSGDSDMAKVLPVANALPAEAASDVRKMRDLIARAVKSARDVKSIEFAMEMNAKNDAQIAKLSASQKKWIERIVEQEEQRILRASKQSAPAAKAVFGEPSGVVSTPVVMNGVIASPARLVKSEAPAATEISFLDEVCGDLKVVETQYRGRNVYGWMLPKTLSADSCMIFCYDKARSSMTLTDEKEDTREYSVLSMLKQAEHIFGEGAFDLTGTDEFKQFAMDVAARNGMVLKGMSPSPVM